MNDTWKLVEIPPAPTDAYLLAIRLNALGSLYFFSKSVLKRNRLAKLHKRLCQSLEREHLKLLMEMSRDHLKTTLITESTSMWWALPFSERDEIAMRTLGYGDEWIRWMRLVHNPSTRTLIVTENEGNSRKFGSRIDQHYFSNDLFRGIFPEILPTPQSTWNSETKHQTRQQFSGQGEGTFDFLGVGGAVQSRHYDRIIQDDLVGREARNSELVMESTIEYHRLLAGVFDSAAQGKDDVGEEIVVGNRWTPWDLNGWIRENAKEFTVESHSAEGGCCDDHPPGVPIFPEEFSLKKLAKIRERLGPYDYAHQYLNLPVMPEECVFNKDWLQYYKFREAVDEQTGMPDGSRQLVLHHEVKDGVALRDIPASSLHRTMVVDPNHAGQEGRARHGIVLLGLDSEHDNIYLLDLWAQSKNYDELVNNIYRMAERWKMNEFWLEVVAAQKYLKFYLDYRSRMEKRKLTVKPLKEDKSKNAKRTRIEALAPLFRDGKFFCQRLQAQFLEEYHTYPSCRTRDILDCIGYSMQTFDSIRFRDTLLFASERNESVKASHRTMTGY